MNSGTCERSTPNPGHLLKRYLEGGECEESFTKLVNYYAPLIYSSALRRCGNRALAEEITQNVITLLARKAPSLSKHPSLTAWVYQSTRLETLRAMRTEKRLSLIHI